MRARLPSILLEGDAPGTPSPFQRTAASAPPQPGTAVRVQPGEQLPATYGTHQLQLTPRDPNWIHAHWDFPQDRLRAAAASSSSGHLTLRLFHPSTPGAALSETPVPPESTRWMVHVPQPGHLYAADLGYYDKDRRWATLAVGAPVRTPPAGPSADLGFEMAALTAKGGLERVEHPTQPPAAGAVVAGAAQPLGARGGEALSSPAGAGQMEFGAVPSSMGLAAWSPGAAWSGVSSHLGGREAQPFRLEVDAELILHGTTDPAATLRIGDRVVALDADGSFHLRFHLPEGSHPVAVMATAAGSGEQRVVRLRFVRSTDTY